ncbi:RAMP superfamily CRISPR-associated protein [Helicobacter sp. T3_23-1059]
MSNTTILAHIILEADSALHFGSGDFDMLYDSPIQRDFNGLPIILGTSICGVIRALAKQERLDLDSLFGGQDFGSRLIFSNALLLDENMKVKENLIPFSTLAKSKFLSHFLSLPQRQHNAIDYNGTCKDGAKFDEEVIFKGARFKCAMSMDLSGGENEKRDKEAFFKILSLFYSPFIRFGAGSTKGFGKIKAHKITYEILQTPFSKSASLNENLSEHFTPDSSILSTKNFTHYTLNLTPENVFLFGAGFGDKEADSIGVSEKIIDYDKGDLSKAKLLIPASSIKGAVSQRTRFYINKHLGNFIGETNELDKKATQIHATLFGGAESSDTKSAKYQATKGKILISDLYLDFDKNKDSQIFAHNSIDRFTGGTIDGAFFQESANTSPAFRLDIFVVNTTNRADFQDFEIALKSFEKALQDICAGILPLGAMSSKGHGFFSGILEKDGVRLNAQNGEKI